MCTQSAESRACACVLVHAMGFEIIHYICRVSAVKELLVDRATALDLAARFDSAARCGAVSALAMAGVLTCASSRLLLW